MQEGTQNPLKFDLKEDEPWMVRTGKIAPRITCGKVRDAEKSGKPQLVCVVSPTSTGRSLGSTRTHPSVCGKRAS